MRKVNESKYDKVVDKALWVFDKFYSVVCGNLECTYCTFYRGVAAGVVLGSLLAYVVVAS